jgi:tyrosine-protein kinase Etk/Wzc
MEKFNVTDSDIDVGKIFRTIMMQSKLIVLISLLGLILGISSYVTTAPMYKVKSLMQVFSTQTTSLSGSGAIDIFSGSEASYDFDSFENLYKSRSNILDIIRSQKLNLQFSESLFLEEQFINIFEAQKKPGEELNYEILFSENTFELTKNNVLLGSFSYGQLHESNETKFNISYIADFEGLKASFNYVNPENVFRKIRNRFNVVNFQPSRNYFARNNSLFEVSFLSKNLSEATRVLDYANALFLENNIYTESEQARKAINFIDQRLEAAETALNNSRSSLKEFQETNKTVNVDLEISTIIETLNKNELSISKLDIEIAKASNNYTETNPLYIDFLNQRQILVDQRQDIEKRIKALPVAQQEYIDLFRNLELTQEVFTQLKNKRLEYSIKEASTLGNIRVIDPAYFTEITEPRLIGVLFVFFAFFVLSIIFSVIRGLYFLPITNPAEIQDNGISLPIFGVTPKLDKLDIDDHDNERLVQSIESMVVNIQNQLSGKTIHGKAGTVLITSPTASNGKSFITRQLATKYSKIGKKTLMFDADFKRGDLHKNYNIKKMSRNGFFNLNEETIKDCKIDENLYLIPKVSGLASSFQLINTFEFDRVIAFLKDYFDLMIIDTAPMLSVSDTAQLLSISDVNLLLTRHSLTKINEIKQMNSLSKQIGVDFDGVIYNSYEKPSSYYGYYGLYGNYDYQYYANKYLYESYDYEKKE